MERDEDRAGVAPPAAPPSWALVCPHCLIELSSSKGPGADGTITVQHRTPAGDTFTRTYVADPTTRRAILR